MDTITTSYTNAIQWAEELWESSKTIPFAARHCPDRIKRNNALLDKFDQSWVKYKSGKEKQETVIKHLLNWIIDIGNISDDMRPLMGINEKAMEMRFEAGIELITMDDHGQLEMAIK